MRCLVVVALLTTHAVVGRRNRSIVLHELEESQRRLLRRRLEVERVVEDVKRQREVERMDKTINGTALEAPCWGFDVRGRKSCLSYDEALAADAAFPPSEVGSVAFVVAWCGDRFDWVSDLMARSRGAPQVWKRLIVYQKCAIYYNASDGGFIVAYRHDGYATTKPQKLDCTVTGPDTTLTSIDVRRSIMNSATLRGQVVPRVDQALRALDIRVVPLIEPGRGYPTGPRQMRPPYSTDEVGAYLHHISRSYDELADGTFFVHGHAHGGYDAAVRTMDWTAASGVAPQTYFGTTRDTDTRVQRGMPVALGVSVNDAMRKPRGGNYRNGEFYASRLSIRRRPLSWFAQAFEIVDRDARCADVYNRIPRPSLPAPFEQFNNRSFTCPWPRKYGGGGAVEGQPAAPKSNHRHPPHRLICAQATGMSFSVSRASHPTGIRTSGSRGPRRPGSRRAASPAVASLMQLLHRAQRDFRSAQGPDEAVVARLREDLEIARGKLATLDPNATLQDLKSFKDAKALLRKTIPTRPATAPPRPPIPATAPPPAPAKATNTS
jgi:hypothetical protein